MKIQPINSKNNLSMQALYFPKTPAHVSINDPKIKKIIIDNPYIKKLSEESDVLVRFCDLKKWLDNYSYSLALDIVDLKSKKTKLAMRYDTKYIEKGKHNISKEKFLSEIKPPSIINSNSRGSLSNKLNRIRKNYKEESPYYKFSFFTLANLKKILWDGEVVPEQLKSAMKLLPKIYRDYIDINKNAISEIIKESTNV